MNIADRYSFDEGAHIHTLDGKPLTGTSSVMDVVAKPLTWWAAGEAVKVLGWTHPKFNHPEYRTEQALAKLTQIKDMDSVQYMALLDEAYSAHNNVKHKAAKKGKNLHSTLEEYVKWCIEKNDGIPDQKEIEDIQNFVTWSVQNIDKFLWSEMHTFSEKEWLGGITDCGARLKDGSVVIIDFKSSKEAYASQFLQIGGYAIQIAENGGFARTGEQVIEPMKVDQFIIIPFGAPEFKVETVKDTPAYEHGFKSALNLYRLQQEYDKEK